MSQQEEINDESDHDSNDDYCEGYYTRAKRRRLTNEHLNVKDANGEEICWDSRVAKRKSPIAYVPTEVLLAIFKHISYHELSTTVRSVNGRFKIVAEDLLNSSYRRLEKHLATLLRSTEISLGYTQDDMEIKCILKLINMLEILNLQYKIVMATIWRYVYNDFYKTCKACMYAGLLIDTYYIFIVKLLFCPQELYVPAVTKDYALPTEVNSIVHITKTFCIHFEKIIEETVSSWSSGCKIVDLLDCGRYCQKTVHYERRLSGAFLAKYTYYFKKAWFVAMPVLSSKEMEEAQKQRLMHLRLRRIVLTHNDMFLQQEQYQREMVLRPNPPSVIKYPGNNVYTGFGDVEDTFFYYGAMNDGAYLSKFHENEDNEEQNEGGGEEIREEEGRNNVERDEEDGSFNSVPYLGFTTDVTIRCSLPMAPSKFLKTLSFNDVTKLRSKHISRGKTRIRMDFECVGASYARLPTQFRYEVVETKVE